MPVDKVNVTLLAAHHYVEVSYATYCSQFANTDLKFYGCVADYGNDFIKKGEEVCGNDANVDEEEIRNITVVIKNEELVEGKRGLMITSGSHLLWPEQAWDDNIAYAASDLEHVFNGRKVKIRWCEVIGDGCEMAENGFARFGGSPIVAIVKNSLKEYLEYRGVVAGD